MAKSFISVNKGLGLYDIIQFGKYKNCRVDSILEQYPDYIIYTKEKFGTLYSKEVLEKVEGFMAIKAKAAELDFKEKLKRFHGSYSDLTGDYEMDDNWMDDIPF